MELSAGQAITVEENTRALLVALGIELNEDARNQLSNHIIEEIENAAHQPALGLRVIVREGTYAGSGGVIIGVDESLFARFHVRLGDGGKHRTPTEIRLAPHELRVIE